MVRLPSALSPYYYAPASRYRYASNQYDVVRSMVMGGPALGGDGARLESLTTLPQLLDYATRAKLAASSPAGYVSNPATLARAVQEYQFVIVGVTQAMANPPGGAFTPASYANKVSEFKASLRSADADYHASTQATGLPTPKFSGDHGTITPTTHPSEQPPMLSSSNGGIVKILLLGALGFGAVVLLAKRSRSPARGRRRRNPRRRR